MLEKELEEWKNWVNESVAFYANKINELSDILKDEELDDTEKKKIESEIAQALDEKKRWDQAQDELET